jgi:hypothetical protein
LGWSSLSAWLLAHQYESFGRNMMPSPNHQYIHFAFLVSMLMYPRPIASLTGHPDVLMEPTQIILECKVDVLMFGGRHHIATKRLVLMS